MGRKAKNAVQYTAEQLAAMDESDRFEAMQAMKFAARAKYIAVLERCKAAQNAYPKLYLLDESTSLENARDGLIQNEGIRMGEEATWCAKGYEYMARNLENDTAMRMAEAGLDPSVYGLRF